MTSDEYPTPVCIPRSDHPVSRKNIDREALKVMYRLRDAGHKAYLVGGGVRDLYLGKKPKDFDISTDARPGQIRKLFRNSRIIGRRFRLVQIFFRGDKVVEVSTFRRRSEFDLNGADKVLASNNTFGSPEEDAFRRDLTINAIFYEIENQSIIDYTGGVQDLKKGVIRIVGDPERRITRDPVRMLRAIRHAARSGFSIEEQTWAAVISHKEELGICPVSRIRDELFKDLLGGASEAWARLAMKSGLFFVLLPFYKKINQAVSLETEAGKELLRIFSVIDRLHKESHRIPEAMVIALILVPWARAEGLIKEPDQFTLTRNIRARLDENLGHLNIKRADKEPIALLLANLSLFQDLYKKGIWPKRLQRKSYFKKCLQFYEIYNESRGGKRVSSLSVTRQPPKTFVRKPSRRGNRQPGFDHKSKHGVFGFKKR
ncbi:MAG: poly(A) polymerase [Desulfobulbaceae bacterium]|nr:poly(A) polymerase [Desulfobulbaceae bacterium]